MDSHALSVRLDDLIRREPLYDERVYYVHWKQLAKDAVAAFEQQRNILREPVGPVDPVTPYAGAVAVAQVKRLQT